MALFSRSKKTEATAEVAQVKGKVAPLPRIIDRNLSTVIVSTHVIEKAVSKSEQNVYTFVVRRDATKFDVRDAVKELYKVTPARVNVVNRAPVMRPSDSRNRMVKVPGMKKAYVYLKKGDTINLV